MKKSIVPQRTWGGTPTLPSAKGGERDLTHQKKREEKCGLITEEVLSEGGPPLKERKKKGEKGCALNSLGTMR